MASRPGHEDRSSSEIASDTHVTITQPVSKPGRSAPAPVKMPGHARGSRYVVVSEDYETGAKSLELLCLPYLPR